MNARWCRKIAAAIVAAAIPFFMGLVPGDAFGADGGDCPPAAPQMKSAEADLAYYRKLQDCLKKAGQGTGTSTASVGSVPCGGVMCDGVCLLNVCSAMPRGPSGLSQRPSPPLTAAWDRQNRAKDVVAKSELQIAAVEKEQAAAGQRMEELERLRRQILDDQELTKEQKAERAARVTSDIATLQAGIDQRTKDLAKERQKLSQDRQAMAEAINAAKSAAAAPGAWVSQ